MKHNNHHKVICIMEMNDGNSITNAELRKLEATLKSNGWSNVHFRRVNPYSNGLKSIFDGIRSFMFE